MKLTIVIPAYNEEQAIAAIIERSLAARETIVRASPASEVRIVVVSDGSTDRTVEIASQYTADIELVVFERNRGYGAAIKRGFAVGDGDVVGFLDADGTCDPAFFATLCNALEEEQADVAIGSRMGPESRMPSVRRLGNRVYAVILSLLSNRPVTDTASGMRVIRRDVLEHLYPLPDGLDFTPAMSARVLMDDTLRLVERPMAYEERIGASKLHVIRDGWRFLRTILEMTLMWRPAKLLFAGAVVCLMVMMLFAMHPVEMWMRVGRLQEDMIYRLLSCSLLGMIGIALLSASVLCDQLSGLIDDRRREPTFVNTMLNRVYSLRAFVGIGAFCVPVLVWLIGEGAWTWLTRGFVSQHWSRAVVAGLLVFALVNMFVHVLIVNIIRFHASRRRKFTGDRPTVAHGAVVRTAEGASTTQYISPKPAGPSRGSSPVDAETVANNGR